MLDADGRFVEVNPAWEHQLGWHPEELIGRAADDFIHPDDLALSQACAARLNADGGEIDGFENRCRCRDGSDRWLSWNARRTPDGFVYAVARDITEFKVRELRLPLSETFFRHLVESSGDAIITKNEDAIITSWNDAATRMYGYTREEAVGRPLSIIVPAERSGEEFEILRSILKGNRIEHYETERVAKDGRRLSVSLSVSPIRDKYGDVVGAAAIARDVTERKRMEHQLRYLAHHDPLTGIFNRGRFQEELEQWLRYARRYRRSGAVLAIDLDGFKTVNDTRGHAAGDSLLQQVASTLTEHVRDADVVARMGGDEFAVLLTEVNGGEATLVAEKLLRQIRCRWGGNAISASIGVAPFDGQSGLTAADLMVAADAALYDAKNAGRNQVVEYAGRRAADLGWVERIRRALDRDLLVLESQPILDLRTGKITHEELLVRMVDEQRTLIPPGRFLPAAERFGLIQEVDRWVICRAIELAGRGRSVAVNLSGHSVADREVITTIEERLQASGADPRKLVFEITETAAIGNIDEASRFARQLGDLGCSFALDDFGTGFGAFTYLKQMPLSYLKIDRGFTRNLTTDNPDRHVVEAVVALAKGFGHMTIAEGIESEAVLRALPGYGVDRAQGFHIGRPAPIAG